jgi:glucuronokinase
MESASGRAFARAALAGNPSDGYGGATLAVVVPDFAAEVQVHSARALRVTPANALVEAAVRRFGREFGVSSDGVAATWTTTIPREVGLAGSSAIVTATLCALCELFDVELEPQWLAALTLAIETEELGIVAGLQDRVAQAYGGLIFMDFDREHFEAHGHGRYEPLDPALLPPVYIAYREDSSGQSGALHAALRARFVAGEAGLHEAMRELAALARGARDALCAGDHERFARCVDGSFDLRRRIVALDPRHVEMVEMVRALGASANYSGSGGALAGSCRDAEQRERVLARLRSVGCGAIALSVTPSSA